jgi:Acyl-coenzyme A synthetases/AMP-(fatty) acid ligases
VFEESRPTIFFGVPVVYNLLLDHHRRGNKLDCSSLRLCVSAGEALPAHLGEEWENEFGVPVVDGIGSTEMLHMFMSNHEHDHRYGSSGKVLDGYQARLLNEEGDTVEQARAICGSRAGVRHLVTGKSPRKLNATLLMDGSAPAISIDAMMTATGFTWAAVMIALNQVDDGYRLLKSRVS